MSKRLKILFNELRQKPTQQIQYFIDKVGYVDYSASFILTTESSAKGCGAMLSQMRKITGSLEDGTTIKEEVELPVSYFFRHYNSPTQRRYSVTRWWRLSNITTII